MWGVFLSFVVIILMPSYAWCDWAYCQCSTMNLSDLMEEAKFDAIQSIEGRTIVYSAMGIFLNCLFHDMLLHDIL